MDPRMQVALAFLKANLHRQISVNELARLVRLSPSRLSGLFLAEVGEPPVRYMRKLRMEKARQYLETTFLSVKEISAKTGYNDATNFMHEFKKAHGMTPSQYRRSNFSMPG